MYDTRFRRSPVDADSAHIYHDVDILTLPGLETTKTARKLPRNMPDMVLPIYPPPWSNCLVGPERPTHRKGIMGITEADVARFAAMAGAGFMWEGVRGTSRPAADVRIPLRLDLAAAQGGVCFACGDVLDETAEFCHIVSRGPKRLGWMPGNIAIGHARCNEAQKEAGPIVHIVDMARPDVVQTEWTPFPVLRRSR